MPLKPIVVHVWNSFLCFNEYDIELKKYGVYGISLLSHTYLFYFKLSFDFICLDSPVLAYSLDIRKFYFKIIQKRNILSALLNLLQNSVTGFNLVTYDSSVDELLLTIMI
ncbi:hypothetical protein QTP88_008525 [Uroleucon formosanum]